jgi:hypothetical protein
MKQTNNVTTYLIGQITANQNLLNINALGSSVLYITILKKDYESSKSLTVNNINIFHKR